MAATGNPFSPARTTCKMSGAVAKNQLLLTAVAAISPDETAHHRFARFHSHRVAGSHCDHRHLAALLLPALAKAKVKAQQIGCLNNYRQLQFCWQMYIDDQQDNLPPNGALKYVANRTDITTEANAWLPGNAYTDTSLTNIQNGVLFPYNKSVGIYKCPGDMSTVLDQGRTPRTRSVSMSIYMNAIADPGGTYFSDCWHKARRLLIRLLLAPSCY